MCAARPTRNCCEHLDEATLERARTELADRIEFHVRVQWWLDEQMAAAQAASREAGMRIGIMHDLAVGVEQVGADSWAPQDVLARGATVGAPADQYNQQGQNWSQPPWHPERLREASYRPWRDMPRTLMRHAGAPRIDHVLGLFRLWWIPEGHEAADGAYVSYDHEAMIGILALEARARAPSSSARTWAPSSRGCATTWWTAGSWAPRSCGSSTTARGSRRAPRTTAPCAWPL
ncbi:4-alpha-glucanotransferase [Brachybacterium sp. GPGPB12]|uniref:4-alpha-glucanotransferase n=1 Tax=Brachybacterium sp. GPGPB12 TaxID=3023517 RepID=UPI0031345CF8